MKHPADMTPEQRAMYQTGYSHVDTLYRLGYSHEDQQLYVQGIMKRLEDDKYKALHPDHDKNTGIGG